MNEDFSALNSIEKPIDRSILDEYVELLGEDGPKSLHRLINIYFDTSPGLLDAMDNALAERNLRDVKLASHSLKSSSAGLGATRLAELCLNLEMKVHAALDAAGGQPQDLDEYQRAAAGIQAEYQRVTIALGLIQDEIEP